MSIVSDIFAVLGINKPGEESEWPVQPGIIRAEEGLLLEDPEAVKRHLASFLGGTGWICFAERVVLVSQQTLATPEAASQFLEKSKGFGPVLSAELCAEINGSTESLHLRQRGPGCQFTIYKRLPACEKDSSWIISHRFHGVYDSTEKADVPDLLYEVCWGTPPEEPEAPLEPLFSRFAGFAP
jgi:hypothetical protein